MIPITSHLVDELDRAKRGTTQKSERATVCEHGCSGGEVNLEVGCI